MKNSQDGIALVQILLITAMLSILSLYLTQTAQQQARMALSAQDKALAQVAIHSTESYLLFELFTNNKLPTSIDNGSNPVENQWNFYNKVFFLSNNVEGIVNYDVGIKIQDQAALINLHFIHKGRFIALLEKNGVSLARSENILNSIIAWQNTNERSYYQNLNGERVLMRNGPLPLIEEINHFIVLTPQEEKLIYDNVGLYFFGDFNPTMASLELIKALSSAESAQQINLLRSQGTYNRALFTEVTGIQEDDDMRFIPSNTLGITYQVNVNEANVTKETVISLSPYAKGVFSPFNILLNRS